MKTNNTHIKNWPINGLEYVKSCPVCNSPKRKILFDNLRDYFFECAPGSWSLHQCEQCSCAYLDPRPDKETINIAYSNYYTHKDNTKKKSPSKRGFWHRLRDDYLAKKYNFTDPHALWPGRWLIHLLPFRKCYIDNVFTRNLPKKIVANTNVLDIGCGNGDFLFFAKKAGWSTRGIDFDPIAVQLAQSRGLNVTEDSIDSIYDENISYDFITLSHVLEHVSDPVKMIEDCYKLLKPGGGLWIETPNIDSNGLKIFKNHWRGLEPPRHFILFNRQSLVQLLLNKGFIKTQDKLSSYVTKTIWSQSQEISIKANQSKRLYFRLSLIICQVKSILSPNNREFITISCIKPNLKS